MDLKNFDPNGVGLENAGIFGLPFSPEKAQVVLIPALWGETGVGPRRKAGGAWRRGGVAQIFSRKLYVTHEQ